MGEFSVSTVCSNQSGIKKMHTATLPCFSYLAQSIEQYRAVLQTAHLYLSGVCYDYVICLIKIIVHLYAVKTRWCVNYSLTS
jgi:hypothetical protein